MNKKSSVSSVKWIVKFAITAGLFVLLFRPDWFGISKRFINVELSDVLNEIRELEFGRFAVWIALGFLIKGSGMFASMLRWDLLLKGQGIVAPFRHLVGTFLVGRFFGAFLPSTLGLDAYRTYDLARHSGLIAANVGVVIVEKIIGLFSLSLLLFFTAPFGVQFVGQQAVYGLLVFFAIPVSLSFTVLVFPNAIVWLLDRSFLRLGLLDRRLRPAVEAVAAYRNCRGLLARAVGYGLIVHTATAFMYYATARAIAADVALDEILFVAPIMIAATVGVPVSMGGEGIREGTFVTLLGLVGVGSAPAFLLSHLGFWVGELISLAGGLIYILRPAGYSPELKGHAIEARKQEEDTETQTPVRGLWQVPDVPMKSALLDTLLLSILAGMAAGLCESALIFYTYTDSDWGAIAFAVSTYGIAGLFGGVGCALGFLLLGRWERTFHECLPTLSAASVFGFIVLIVSRFRIRRDIFSEHLMGKKALLVDVGLMAAIGVFVLVAGIGLAARWWPPTSKRRRPIATAALAVAVALAVFSLVMAPENPVQTVHDTLPEPKPALSVNDAPHIALVVIDALRKDALGIYGAPGNPTPNLDRFSQQALRFDRTLAQASWTRPSFATLFSSRYPSNHTAEYKFSTLPGDLVTLAEALQERGYQTVGIANNTNIAPAFNFQQGFDKYIYLAPDNFFGATASASRLVLYQVMRKFRAKFGAEVPNINFFYRDAAFVNDTVQQTLADLDASRPVFLFVHYMEPHDPYVPHPPESPDPNGGTGVVRARTPKPDPKETERLKKLYAGEIEYLDTHFGALLELLEPLASEDRLATLVTSDHGEEFFDHQGWWHGTTLYEEAIAVPMIVRLPGGVRAGETDFGLSRLLDVAPTLLTLAGAPVPEGIQGHGLLNPDRPSLSYVFAEEDHEGNVLFSLRGERMKLIQANRKNPRRLAPIELYDLERDPFESNNLVDEDGFEAVIETWTNELAAAKAIAAEGAVLSASTTLDEETREQLEAIGYF